MYGKYHMSCSRGALHPIIMWHVFYSKNLCHNAIMSDSSCNSFQVSIKCKTPHEDDMSWHVMPFMYLTISPFHVMSHYRVYIQHISCKPCVRNYKGTNTDNVVKLDFTINIPKEH